MSAAGNELDDWLLATTGRETVEDSGTAQSRSIQSNNQLGHTVSTVSFAKMLGTSHEYARRLVATSRCGMRIPGRNNTRKHSWLISRTWAEKFVRLRGAFRLAENRQRPSKDNLDYQPRPYLALTVTGSDGTRKVLSLNEHDLEVLIGVWGSLPLLLTLEDASVLRAITRQRIHPNPMVMQALGVFSGRMTPGAVEAINTVSKPEARWWNERLAELIERTGQVEVTRDE
jgi:hypothetical protein